MMQRIEEEDYIPSDSSLSEYENAQFGTRELTYELTNTATVQQFTAEETKDDAEDAVEAALFERAPTLKDEASRSSDGRKASNVEMFPMLVRGLETVKSEGMPRHSDSFHDAPARMDSLQFTKSRFPNEDGNEDDSEVGPYVGPPLCNKANLEKLLKSHVGALTGEQLLLLAIDDSLTSAPDNYKSLSEKLGFGTKSRETMMLEKGLATLLELNSTLESLTEEIKEKERQQEETRSRQVETSEKVAVTTEEVTARLTAIKDARQQLVQHSEKLARALTGARAEVQEYEAALTSAKEQASDLIAATEERYERGKMRVEELLARAANTYEQIRLAKATVQRNSPLISVLHTECAKEQRQEEMIEICLLLLNDSLEFFERNQERSAFIGEFMGVLKHLKEACFSAVDADRAFHDQATSDPRSLLPYSRSHASPLL